MKLPFPQGRANNYPMARLKGSVLLHAGQKNESTKFLLQASYATDFFLFLSQSFGITIFLRYINGQDYAFHCGKAGFTSKSVQIEKLEKVQNRCSRCVTGNYKPCASVTVIKETLGGPPLSTRRKCHGLKWPSIIYYDRVLINNSDCLGCPSYLSERIDH